MELDAKVVTALAGLAGLLIAAILSSAGFLYRNRLETKKSARQVSYLLLEIRHAINVSIFDPSEAAKQYIERYVQRLNDRGINAKLEDVTEALKEFVENHFANLAKAAKIDIEERLLHPFEEALSNLASISPVLAFRLRGKEKLEVLAVLSSSYAEAFQTTLLTEIEEDWLKRVMIDASNETKSEALEKMVSHLDEEILLVAKHCSWFDYRECRDVISMKAGELNSQDFADLDKLFDKLLDQLIEAGKKAPLATSNNDAAEL